MSRSRQQVVRMLALVPYLQGNDGVPVNEVAAEFGVTPKVIRDDLRLLMYTGTGEYAGELIDFDLTALEQDGIVHIRDAEFMTRPLRISAREGIALIVALRTLRASASGLEVDVIDSALAKLESAVGDTVSASVDVLLDKVDPAIHGTIVEALTGRKRLALTYATASRDERSDRDVDPKRLFTEQGKLYLEAYCLKVEDMRFFRLDRIVSADVLAVDAEDHDDAPRDLSEGFFTVGEETPFVVVDLHPKAHWLTEYYQVDLVSQDDDGIWRAKIYGADWSWLRRLVLRNAGSVSVIEPDTLRSQVVDDARLALQAYSDDVVPKES
ncbi:helix-turn-helix transcriptional regulator [Aeromicrobium fastidiosum]|uniref:WYL domain-containing protein n=1 Tax=Aeromicrobium fastidiosum TaxID=52699 RepID=A0A641AKC9_9ACTN|nr:WYL domain-containing protein [Aeromicrobium fastidiosum]KAA1376291.1 WYL domain-containing protein [Aeromicrobium fastidiosum]MBP2391812.1 proteasome accessory factor C [Aeromicrobium fastidiosum]